LNTTTAVGKPIGSFKNFQKVSKKFQKFQIQIQISNSNSKKVSKTILSQQQTISIKYTKKINLKQK
jgi:hypothetical protein